LKRANLHRKWSTTIGRSIDRLLAVLEGRIIHGTFQPDFFDAFCRRHATLTVAAMCVNNPHIDDLTNEHYSEVVAFPALGRAATVVKLHF
jgi:hypothetical protein